MNGPALRAQGLRKSFRDLPLFAGLELTVKPGEFVAVMGESGVGKSTFLNTLAGLDSLDEGEVWVSGHAVTTATEAQRAMLRRQHLGFIFQAFHVLPHLSVAQNVALPLMLLKRPDEARVLSVLDAVGLGAHAERMPATLSGGQLQRVAIARALVHRPAVILADEPTGNLDPDTAERVMDVLVQQVKQASAACILVTHSPAAAARADRRLSLTANGLVG